MAHQRFYLKPRLSSGRRVNRRKAPSQIATNEISKERIGGRVGKGNESTTGCGKRHGSSEHSSMFGVSVVLRRFPRQGRNLLLAPRTTAIRHSRLAKNKQR